ncbi:dTDP-4-dehydrorhamnose reductase family protein [Enterovibrio nigricans]|uniref:dTDP-4-dehydrorhamnose reductase n=1 Tax=Enterovibrio nigricans DSM 22720 TaxID=1121868 RepID=A0A1T4U7Y8_9GAMM|nr:SDR family oxidoreductase [Enterovibrio nigricans]SKA48777.1 dTDP-4-dehydrorhamnose reductase [Enterovibrio nigricans DSM 22720]
MKVLVIGATGMLGYSLFTNLTEVNQLEVYGTVRSLTAKEHYFSKYADKIVLNIDVNDDVSIKSAFETVRPDVVLNCVGLIKQHDVSKQHIAAIEINALLPHKLASFCDSFGAKLIHFSTDCVFDGAKGGYSESDEPNASDLYGKSKCLGEVSYGNHLTLRTSIIGHELNSSVSLVDWFLSQSVSVKGFSKAIFSGLPTSYIAKILAENILPRKDLVGLFNLSVEPIDKYSLLRLIAEKYGKEIEIEESDQLVIDRSLNSTKLRKEISLDVPKWEELIDFMYEDYAKRYKNEKA